MSTMDRDELDGDDFGDLIERFESAEDESLPEITAVSSLVERGEPIDERTIDSVLAELDSLFAHDRLVAHRLGAAAAVALAESAPEATDRLLEHVLPLLAEEGTKRRSLAALEQLATVRPTAVSAHLPAIVELTDDPRESVRHHAAGTVLAIAEGAPSDLVDSVPALLDELRAPFELVEKEIAAEHALQQLERSRRLEHELSRATISRAIAAVARERPEETARRVVEADAVGVLTDLFDDDQPIVRGAAVGTAAYVADYDPRSIAPATPQLLDLLEDDHEVVRGSAIWTLRALESDRALEGLRRARRSESVSELRDLAETAVRELEEER